MIATLTSPAARGLLRAIVEDPLDDVPRLLLADVLEEAGEGERAEFIRVQCELARLEQQEGRPTDSMELLGWTWGYHLELLTLDALRETGHRDCEFCLRRRERELFAEAYPALTSDLPGAPVDYLVEGLSCRRRFGDRTAIFSFRRGFVASVNLTCADWCGGECPCYWTEQNSDGICSRCHGTGRTSGHGPALVLAAPIEQVNIVSVHNGRGEDLSAINNLLREIHEQIDPGAVSNALLAWARQEAGLPPLRP